MKTKSIIVLAVSVVAAGTLILLLRKKIKVDNMLDDVADEGYETAHDILYPQSTYRRRGGSYLPA
jgi:hypothetical protein